MRGISTVPMGRAMCGLVLMCAALASAQSPPAFNCSTQPSHAFTPITLTNTKGTVKLTMIAYGATATGLVVRDNQGVSRDVLLGFEDPTLYCATPHPYFGATIGRIANRVAECSFSLGGKEYKLSCNDKGYDTLHGGFVGFDRRVWTPLKVTSSSVTWHYYSPDGEMGFPGAVNVSVTHEVTEEGEWRLSYHAVAGDAPTVLSMTNHAYFNLNANVNNTSTVLDHMLSMPVGRKLVEVTGAPEYHLVPTGKVTDIVAGSALDFYSQPKQLGKDIDKGNVTALGGYDNAFVFSPAPERGTLKHVLTLSSPITGISVDLLTDQPSVQIYTGNFLNGTDPAQKIARKKSQCDGVPAGECFYQYRGAITLETQLFPDAVHHPSFPSMELPAGGEYRHITSYKFGTEAKQ